MTSSIESAFKANASAMLIPQGNMVVSAVADCGAAALLVLMGDVDRARASVLAVGALGAAIRECQPCGCLCITRPQVVQVKRLGLHTYSNG